MGNEASPFGVLSLIVAPAILTNASSVLAMSTTNRLARAVDRARELSKQLEATLDLAAPQAVRRLHELSITEERTMMLVKALGSFYIALGSFASAALFALLGAEVMPIVSGSALRVLPLVGVAAGGCRSQWLGRGPAAHREPWADEVAAASNFVCSSRRCRAARISSSAGRASARSMVLDSSYGSRSRSYSSSIC